LDVVKTRIQTQLNPNAVVLSSSRATNLQQSTALPSQSQDSAKTGTPPIASEKAAQQRRHISTSSPSTSVRKPGSVNLDTSSVITGLKLLYRTEGIAGWFRGVGPRAVWTSVQSGTMLVLYQALLRQMEVHPPFGESDGAAIV